MIVDSEGSLCIPDRFDTQIYHDRMIYQGGDLLAIWGESNPVSGAYRIVLSRAQVVQLHIFMVSCHSEIVAKSEESSERISEEPRTA